MQPPSGRRGPVEPSAKRPTGEAPGPTRVARARRLPAREPAWERRRARGRAPAHAAVTLPLGRSPGLPGPPAALVEPRGRRAGPGSEGLRAAAGRGGTKGGAMLRRPAPRPHRGAARSPPLATGWPAPRATWRVPGRHWVAPGTWAPSFAGSRRRGALESTGEGELPPGAGAGASARGSVGPSEAARPAGRPVNALRGPSPRAHWAAWCSECPAGRGGRGSWPGEGR